MTEWWDDGPDDGEWWWAVEHFGHPCYYLRALVPGDFAPGQEGPLARHVLHLDGSRPQTDDPQRCGTCELVPEPKDLDAIERRTGDRAFLTIYRDGRERWPKPTDATTCWLCSDPRAGRADQTVDVVRGRSVRVCARCAAHLGRARRA